MATRWEDVEREIIDTPEMEHRVQEHLARMRAEERAYKLAEARKERHLTQEQLAKRLGVSQRRVSAIEHGKVTSARVETLARYCAALGGTLEVTVAFGDERIRIA